MESNAHGLNQVQAKVQLVNAPQTVIVMARGTGKTAGILGPKSISLIQKMPRAKGGFIGKDYPQLEQRTLPEIVSVWEKLGFYEGAHWCFGEPKPGWDRPIVPPINWKHYISWYNGHAIALLSLQVEGAANGASFQWIMGDEAKFWNPNKLKEILKAVRGLRAEFGHLPEYLSQWYATDKWVDDLADIQWILDKKKQMDPLKVETIYTLQLEVNELRAQLKDPALDDLQLHEIDSEILQLETILKELRRNTFYYAEGKSEDNIIILGQEYLDKMKQDLPKEEYDVAHGNQDPTASRNTFYPAIKDTVHKYESDNDVIPTQPLIIAADYQASIAPITVAQYGMLSDNQDFPTLNFCREEYVLEGDGKSLKDAIRQFCNNRQNHLNKLVYYVYDHTAIGRTPFGKSYKDLVVDTLIDHDWAYVEIFTGKAPLHGFKYQRLKQFYENTSPLLFPLIRINSRHCPAMCESLKRARTKQGTLTEKDKRHENIAKYPYYPQQFATHFSDAHDQLLWATHELNRVPMGDTSSFVGAILSS